MLKRKRACALLFALALTVLAFSNVSAQETPARAEVNHEVVVHLLVTSDGSEGLPRPPQSLEGVVRQLKASLPPSDYRLAATFINRVRDGASFDVKTAGTGPFGPEPPNQLVPSFITIQMSGVKLLDPASAQPSINVQQFRLVMRLPFQTASVKTDKGEGNYPVVQFDDVGVSSQLSVRESEPTLVGTLNSSRPGQLFIIVVTIRRTGK